MHKKAFFIVIICMMAFHVISLAQDKNSINFYTIKSGPGKVLKAFSGMPETNISWFTGFEYGTRGNGKHAWEKVLNYPEYGLEVLYGNLNNDILGNVFAIQPFMRFPLREEHKRFQVYFTGGLGFAYFDETYHFFDNPQNGLIGSNINNYTKGEIEIGYLFKNWRIFASMGAFHFSNAHVRLPNIGANVPESKIGITWYAGKHDIMEKKYGTIDSTWSVNVRYGIGCHSYGSTMKPFEGPVFPVHSVSFGTGKNISAAYRISFGGTIGYYSSFNNFLLSEFRLNKHEAALKSGYASVFFGQELMFGKIAVYGEFALDIAKPFYREYGDIFDYQSGFSGFVKKINSNRLGLRYYLKEINQKHTWNMSFGMFIKSNFSQADFGECAIQLKF